MKLTAATVVEHYKQGYGQIEGKLHDWEQAKARFLVDVGRECLMLVRQSLEPLGELELTARKNERAKVVKQLEELLPELDGIGVPQLNRWIRWAGVGEVLTPDAAGCAADGNGVFLSWPCGLKQAHLMVLEKFVEQHEPTGTFRIKEPWQNRLDEVRNCIKVATEAKATAAELESALDEEAEFTAPKPPEPQAETSPIPQPNAKPSAATSTSSTGGTPVTSTVSKPTPPSPTLTKPVPAASGNRSPSSAGKSPAPTPAAMDSSRKPAPSPTSTGTAAPLAGTSVSPKDLADQAFKLMQQPEILAGVFRREWPPELVLAIVENLIKAMGENSKNLLGLARAYHRMAPVVLTHFEAYIDEGKFKLRKKDQPEPPTLEQLAPCGELATA
jgi:hypothetical protein